MAPLSRATSLVIATGLGLALAGCANDGASLFAPTTTASIPEKPKVDPVCVTLTSQIDGLKKEGVAEKVEKAAARKYRMKTADLAKAAQLNQANAEFQNKCSALTPMTTAQVSSMQATTGGSAAPTAAAADASMVKAKAQTTESPMGPVSGDQ